MMLHYRKNRYTKPAKVLYESAEIYDEFKRVNPRFDSDKFQQFKFEPPIQCPTYYPTKEEFQLGPINYIKKITPYAKKFGAVKIIPPAEFVTLMQKRLIIDDGMKFINRIQRLNEGEATTLCQLIFFETFQLFWHLKGIQLMIPIITNDVSVNKSIESLSALFLLYQLQKLVKEYGGYEKCCQEQVWPMISKELKIDEHLSSQLQNYYRLYVKPYVIFMQQTKALTSMARIVDHYHDENFTAHDDDFEEPKLKRRKIEKEKTKSKRVKQKRKTILPTNKKKNKRKLNPIIIFKKCMVCFKECFKDNCLDNDCLNCSKCKKSVHKKCIDPQSEYSFVGQWNCDDCFRNIFKTTKFRYSSKLALGFSCSTRSITLNEFREFAEQFESFYFSSLNNKTSELIEKEFWRISSDPQSRVVVQYGNDVSVWGLNDPREEISSEESSTDDESSYESLNGDLASLVVKTYNLRKITPKKSIDQINYDKVYSSDSIPEEYLSCPWYLDILPRSSGSVFEYFREKIDGITEPWLYVGMLFTMFNWHVEDHYFNSINYLHCGAPKTWYCVPGSDADKFKNAMRKIAPELFEEQTSNKQMLIHCNPNLLQKHGVRVYRIDQYPGEFVTTFPQAYHAGFNQGYNIAEAVNFGTGYWLKYGRKARETNQFKKRPLLSYDKLVLSLGKHYRLLSLDLLDPIRLDYQNMIEIEKVTEQIKNDYQLKTIQTKLIHHLDNNSRYCYYCFDMFYISAIRCSCSEVVKYYCVNHFPEECKRNVDKHRIVVSRYKKHLSSTLETIEKLLIAKNSNA